MSINYHAYQCREYLLSEYEGIEKSWQEIFTGYDPARAVSVLGLKADESFLYIEYYGQKFRLRLADGVLFKHSGLSGKELEDIRDRQAQHKSVFDLAKTDDPDDFDDLDDFDNLDGLDAFGDLDPLSGSGVLSGPGALSGPGGSGALSGSCALSDSGALSGPDHLQEAGGHGAQEVSGTKGGADSAPVTGHVRRRAMIRSAAVDPDGYCRRVRFNEGMAIYHYLQFFRDQPAPPSLWIPNTALDTRAVNYSATEDLLFHSFCQAMAGKADQLDRICPELGGVSVASKADYSYEFQAFPGVKLRLLYWEEDDEFPAKAQILVDRNVTDYVHLETTGCIACDLFDMITDRLV